MIKVSLIAFCFFPMILFVPLDTFAHSGGTNAEGCHNNRKTGEYHCHNKKLKSRQIEKTDANNETGDEDISSNEKLSSPPYKKRIFQWVDENGKVHYSDNIKDVPFNKKESMNTK